MTRTPVADWQQLAALYQQAIALQPDALAAFLEKLQRQAHPLLVQLEQMLDARSQADRGDVAGAQAPEPEPVTHFEAAPIGWQAGARVGAYRLVRRVGTGGMAEVWLAYRDDGAFRRQVAIKLLFRYAGSHERDAFALRFDRERDILASLDHPNIASLHDAGVTAEGQPWLALEYVKGESLTAWCDARRLGLTARVRLFGQVLLAVRHAHANLVIHRDIKPGNILVTAHGEVRLLDFGIAKLMEPTGGPLADTELTRMAGRAMTPQYASPEQLLGKPLTTGSDVYSLGVVLYELLCGERPYELKTDSPAHLERSIIEIDPRPPSRRAIPEAAAVARGSTGVELRRELANDLDAIVLHALAKRAAQRYGSVEALAADLERWLDGEPVQARAPSTFYRAGKFVRRHLLAVSLSAGAVLALLVVTAAAVMMGLQAREDSARAVAARDFMLDIFRRADQEKSHGADITARDLLETGRRDVLTQLTGQPRLQAELLGGIAKIQEDMGEYAAADATLEELARTWAGLGRPRERALAQLDRALNALGMNKPALTTRLLNEVVAEPDLPDHDAELDARLARVTGLLALNAGQAEDARRSLTAARETAIRQLGESNLQTFWLGQALARADRDSGRTEDALVLQDGLRETARRIGALGPDEFANLDWEQVNLLYSAGRFEKALQVSGEALPHCIQSLGGAAQMCRYLAVRHAQLLLKLGRLDEARQVVPQVQGSAEDADIPFLQIESLLFELRLATAEQGQGGGQARSEAFEKVRGFATSTNKLAALRAGAMLGLAESLLRVGDPVQAKTWIGQALALLGESADRPPRSRTGANARMLLGIASLEEGVPTDAPPLLHAALAYFSNTLGEDHPATQIAALDAALAAHALGAASESLALTDRSEYLLQEAFGPASPAFSQVRAFRGLLKNPGTSSAPGRRGSGLDNVPNAFFSN